MTRDEWLARLSAELGVAPPTPEDVEVLLAVAGEAAHAAERSAAPLTCWLAARAGLQPSAALETVRRLAAGSAPPPPAR